MTYPQVNSPRSLAEAYEALASAGESPLSVIAGGTDLMVLMNAGLLRASAFLDIWRQSPRLAEVRAIRARDLTTCSSCGHVGSCSRCPGLAYMEGNMRGPSSADCEKSFARTGVPSANMLLKAAAST